jgi:hypothetical protein
MRSFQISGSGMMEMAESVAMAKATSMMRILRRLRQLPLTAGSQKAAIGWHSAILTAKMGM